MEQSRENNSFAHKNLYNLLILIFIGVVVNLAGSKLAAVLNLSLYFDSIGTIFAAITGGYIPGVMAGFITNIIKGVTLDDSALFFGTLNVAIAVVAAFFSSKKYLKNVFGVVALILISALIGGALGSVLTWYLGNSTYGDFLTGLYHDFPIDVADKAISIILVLLIIKILPDNVLKFFDFVGWQQTPISDELRRKINKSNLRYMSLRTKLLLVLIAAMLSIAIAATGISFALYRSAAVSEYTKLAEGVTGVISGLIDAERVDEYIENADEAEGYTDIENMLYDIKESSADIEYLYVYQIREDGCHVVFDLDTEDLEGANAGDVIPFDSSFDEQRPLLLEGKEIEPIISNDTYGWLLTVYTPVYDSTGKCVCYACADVSMSTLINDETVFFTKLVSLFLGFFIMVLAIGLWLAEYNLILPINSIAYAAGAFAYNSKEARDESVKKINELDIHTGDEIENLYHAIASTTDESMHFVADLQRHTETIEKMQNGMILVLADLVESRDKNTGQHVRKTAAYTKIIMEELLREGKFKDELTEEFMYDVFNSAPLHDVGKITIPDAILNKPGRLDDDEFAIMRSHAAAGREVINKVIDIVPDSEYMKEARNLAAHHHERWDGKGYPDGLKGEEIPLSARIMAVADVFDALYSKRSYKEGFSFEKSLSIIEEGIGTQFDPDVARAFLNAKDTVYEVAESFKAQDN